MIKEAENIILNKEYYELSAEELATVSELVQNAEEFEEMKWFLASTQQALVNDKIEATPELKKRVMDHLHQPKDERKFWLNGVVVFLFPEDKKFYQKPAFQMSIAALLIIGFLMVYDRPLDEQSMALHDAEEVISPMEDEIEREVISSGEEALENEFSSVYEETLPDDAVLTETDEEIALEQPVIVYDMNIESEPVLDEVSADDIPHDGYYQGPIEEAEEVSDLSIQNNKSDNFGGATVPSTNSTTTTGLGNAVVDSDQSKDRRDKNSMGSKKLKTSDNLLSKRNETRSAVVSEDAANEVDNTAYKPEGMVGGIADEEDKKGEFKEQQQEKIKPYEVHVNESKELKSLFGTFK